MGQACQPERLWAKADVLLQDKISEVGLGLDLTLWPRLIQFGPMIDFIFVKKYTYHGLEQLTKLLAFNLTTYFSLARLEESPNVIAFQVLRDIEHVPVQA